MQKISPSFRARERLPDGRILHIRPIRPGDREKLREEFLKLSPASIRDRFFNAKTDLTPGELTYFTEVDFSNHVALVAELETDTGLRPAGIGRFVRRQHQPDHCEAAITVADALHGLGIGKILLRQLINCARELGLRRFDAAVLPQNKRMATLLYRTGLPIKSGIEDGILTYSLSL